MWDASFEHFIAARKHSCREILLEIAELSNNAFESFFYFEFWDYEHQTIMKYFLTLTTPLCL